MSEYISLRACVRNFFVELYVFVLAYYIVLLNKITKLLVLLIHYRRPGYRQSVEMCRPLCYSPLLP